MARIPVSTPQTSVEGYSKNYARSEDSVANAIVTGVTDTVQMQMKLDERDAAAYTTKAFSDFQVNEMMALDEEKQSGDPKDFTARYVGNYDKRLQSYIDAAPDDIARSLIADRGYKFKDSMVAKSLTYEATQRQVDAMVGLDTAETNYYTMGESNPDQIPDLIAQYNGDLRGTQGRLTPKQMYDRQTKFSKNIYQRAATNMIEHDPGQFLTRMDKGELDSLYAGNEAQKEKDRKLAEKSQNAIIKRSAIDDELAKVNTRLGFVSNLEKVKATDILASSLPDDEKEKMLEIKISGVNNYVKTNNKVYLDISKRALAMQTKAHEAEYEGNPDVSIKEATDLYNDATAAIQGGAVNYKDIQPTMKFLEKTMAGMGDPTAMKGLPILGNKLFQSYAEKITDPARQAKLYNNYLSKLGIDESEGADKKAASEAIDADIRAFNPAYVNKPELPTFMLNPANVKVPTGTASTAAQAQGGVTVPKTFNGGKIIETQDGYIDKTTGQEYDKQGKEI
jgi:hypothetical protein